MTWPGMSAQIEDMILRCATCIEERPEKQKEPLLPHDVPEQAWQKLGVDLFKGKDYLLVVDYYSKYFKVSLLIRTHKQEPQCST